MNIRKALITAANPRQRTLPLQTLVDRDGESKSALQIILEEAASAGIEEFGVVVCPGDEVSYAAACGPLRPQVRFLPQPEPRGEYREEPGNKRGELCRDGSLGTRQET